MDAICFTFALRKEGKEIKIKTFTFMFIVIYVAMSLPAILGLGYVIDWIPETTLLEKIKGHVIEGLVNNYLFKMVVSGVVSVYSQFHFYKGCER